MCNSKVALEIPSNPINLDSRLRDDAASALRFGNTCDLAITGCLPNPRMTAVVISGVLVKKDDLE